MAAKTNMKCKELLVSEKVEIIKKVAAQQHAMHTKYVRQFSIPMPMLNSITA
jgi:hypothetical protein